MTQNTEKQYFDLTTSGIGYLNRARTVTPKKGKPYPAVSISALHGNVDEPNYTHFDVRVVGEAAMEFVKQHEEAINNRDSKVLVRFNVGDATPTSYVVQSGEQKGQERHLIKGRLLKITWAKINNDVLDLGTEGEAETPAPVNAVDEGVALQAGVSQQQPETPIQQEQCAPAEDLQTWETQLGNVVKLDKLDPEFQAKRHKLKNLGYQWNKDEMAWHKAAA